MRLCAVVIAVLFALCRSSTANAQSPVDSSLAAFINSIKAVDNHSHVNSVSPADSDFDALPLDGLPPASPPMRLRPEALPGLPRIAHSTDTGMMISPSRT